MAHRLERPFEEANKECVSGTRAERGLTNSLVGLDYSYVSGLFAKNETATPTVLWNPSPFDILHPSVQHFAEFMSKEGAVKKTREELFSSINNRAFEPWLMVLEPVPGRADFRYLRYGAEIAAIYGRDLTGHCTSEIGGHISEYFIALYAAVLERKQSVLSVHVPPMGVFATVWRRLIFPILDGVGNVQLIVAVNVPDNELCTGLEALPDPTLVASEDGVLMYANVSARRLFGEPALPRKHVSEYCDIDISLPPNIERFSGTELAEISQAIGAREQMLVHLELRTSATIFRKIPYFVVQLKPT